MKVVVDTNVIVSGLLSPFAPPAEIVRMIAGGSLELAYDARILSEYREVLLRPRFGFQLDAIRALLDQIRHRGTAIVGEPLARHLPDPTDEPFLQVALAASAECLITGNLKHFPSKARQNMKVLPPKKFLEFYAESMR